MRGRRFLRLAVVAALAFQGAAICTPLRAQKKTTARPEGAGVQAASPAKPDEVAGSEAGAARYAYEFTNPAFFVSHIQLVHDATGRGTVTFKRKTSDEAIVEPLELSPDALRRINARWEALRFLDSDANYQSDKQFPHLGTMRLSLARDGRERTAEFNWSDNPDAAALASEYRRAADQVMVVFEINVARENQPLESPKHLENLDRLVSRGGLSDARQLIPLLRDLSTDERLPLIARNKAGKILQKVEKQDKKHDKK